MTQRLGRRFPVRQLRSPLRQDLRVCADAAERRPQGPSPSHAFGAQGSGIHLPSTSGCHLVGNRRPPGPSGTGGGSRMLPVNGVGEPWCGRTACRRSRQRGLETEQPGHGHDSEAACGPSPGKVAAGPNTRNATAQPSTLPGSYGWADAARRGRTMARAPPGHGDFEVGSCAGSCDKSAGFGV